jgi:O-antigen ligase
MKSDRFSDTWDLKLFYGAVCLLAFTTPLSLVAAQAGAALVIIIGAWLFIRRFERDSVSPLGTGLIIGLLLAVLISALASGFYLSLPQLKKSWILLAFLPLAYFSRYYSKDKVLSLLIFGSALASLIGTVRFLIGDVERAAPYSGGYTTMALLDAALIPIALAFWLTVRNKWRHYYLAALFLMLIGLAASQTRAGWVGAFVALVILASRKELKLVIIGFIYLLIILAVIPGGFKKAKSVLTFGARKEFTTGRSAIWTLGVEMVPYMPVWGYGPSSFKRLMPQELLDKIGDPAVNSWHSTPLEILLESGYLGLACIIGIWTISISAARKRYKVLKDNQWLNLSILGGLIGLYLAGLTTNIMRDFMLSTLSVVFWAIIFVKQENSPVLE